MPFIQCLIQGLIVIEPAVIQDSRGYFFEAYNQATFLDHGIDHQFLQDNQSKSSFGVIRGLHYQNHPHAQAKLVRVISGSILDVAVDIRKSSPTFGQHYAIELSAENNRQLFIPQGFAHGFSVLTDSAIVLYKCDKLYHKASEAGIRFDDPELNIDWQLDMQSAIISEKDRVLPSFRNCVNNFE